MAHERPARQPDRMKTAKGGAEARPKKDAAKLSEAEAGRKRRASQRKGPAPMKTMPG